MSWDIPRGACSDSWQESIWDSARRQGFNEGYQQGVVHAISAYVDFCEEKGIEIPHGTRSAILSLLDKDA